MERQIRWGKVTSSQSQNTAFSSLVEVSSPEECLSADSRFEKNIVEPGDCVSKMMAITLSAMGFIAKSLGDQKNLLGTRELPGAVLPHVADITFSDGAAFVTASKDGSISVTQHASSVAGKKTTVEAAGYYGEIWRLCTGDISEMILLSHMSGKDTEKLGIKLPAGSSVIVMPLGSKHCPVSCVCVYRRPDGGQAYSHDSYEVGETEQLKTVTFLLSATVDVRAYVQRVVLLKGIRRSSEILLEAIRPNLVVLHETARVAPPELGDKIDSVLSSLNDVIDQMQISMIGGA